MWSVEPRDRAVLGHKTWRTLEPLHGMVYFVPEAAEEYARLGIEGRDGYFASRAAPMGAVSREVVVATFFNFHPALVAHAIPAAWERATPEDLITARFKAGDRALRRILGAEILASPQMERACDLARRAAEVAMDAVAGRPLCAGHASVPWPREPHLALWHAQSILREYRGDGHVASLLTHGLSGLEALITHAAQGDVPAELLRTTRGWSQDEWREGVVSLTSRGWLTNDDALRLSPWGSAQRNEIERETDELASAPYAALGDTRCEELRALVRPWSRLAVGEMGLGPADAMSRT